MNILNMIKKNIWIGNSWEQNLSETQGEEISLNSMK